MFLLISTAALAHEPGVTPQNWPSAWSWELGITIPILLTGIIYLAGTFQIYRRNRIAPAIRAWEVASFWGGWLTLVIALNSPLHRMGEELFSAHMTQHELLMVLAAPLLVLGRPLVVFLHALPPHWRPAASRWTKHPAFRRTWQILTGALMVWLIHGLTIWLWHIPALYEATLDHEAIHALQHVMFLGTALLFWWTLIHGAYGRMGYGVAFLYVFTTAIHTSVLGALMTFAQRVWYPIYDGRTAPWHLTPLQDQQLGGLIMWIPSGTVFVVVGLAMFAAWIGESDRRGKLSRLDALVLEAGGKDAA
jgi:cytochrome c oxidase assembly factor CtaG